jgi:hypothetical protein
MGLALAVTLPAAHTTCVPVLAQIAMAGETGKMSTIFHNYL